MTLYTAGNDGMAIRDALEKGQLLVACLCAGWCTSCEAWQQGFEDLANAHPEHCFVWLDIEDNADMVAEVDLETLPVLLLQQNDTIFFLGTILPKASVLKRLLQHCKTALAVDDPGIYQFLLEDV